MLLEGRTEWEGKVQEERDGGEAGPGKEERHRHKSYNTMLTRKLERSELFLDMAAPMAFFHCLPT